MDDEAKQPSEIVMTITLSPDGKIHVKGPISQKLLAYGLLEAARDAINEEHQRQRLSVVKPNGRHAIMDFVRGGKGG